MRNIIYIGNFELPDKNAAAHRVINNAKAIREIGYNVIFIDTSHKCSENIIETKDICFGFEKYSMQHNNTRLISIRDFMSVYSHLNTTVYAVIAYNYPGIALWKLLNFCRKNKIKLFADSTEWFGFVGKNLIVKCVTGMDSFIRMNLVQPKLDGVIAISRYIESYYQKKTLTICVPPLTDITDTKWNFECEHNNDYLEILYAGNPGKHKDKLNKMIEAFSKIDLSWIHLTIIGITKEQFLNNYPEDKGILNSMRETVEFKGRISHEEVLNYLKQADFSMFYRDVTRVTIAGFPTKFSEAITCGTPVITNRTSDLEKYLIEGINGYWIDNIEKDVIKLLKKNRVIRCKNTVDRSLFDYKSYTKTFMGFLEGVKYE